MALRNRNYFFDPMNTDRFSSRDIPTEQTMSDWCDSVPFIKEPTDKSQLTRAGIAKTTSDAKINAGDNTDTAGVSPVGFTTFVRPAQIPKMIDSADIVWTKVPRGGSDTGDQGAGIEDWSGAVQFPAFPTYDATEIPITTELLIKSLTGALCDPIAQLTTSVAIGSNIEDALIAIQNSLGVITSKIVDMAVEVCDAKDGKVNVGDIILSVTSSGAWSDKWLEPDGRYLDKNDYPELHAIFTTTYGPYIGNTFKIPDMVSQQNYMRVKQNVGLLPSGQVNGGAASRTLDDADMPDHSHTVTGTTSNEQHTHTFPIGNADPGAVIPDGNGGGAGTVNYTTPADGDHTHSVTGTTNTYGNVTPNPVWDMNTAVTPRFTNFYLKMRVKP